VEYQPAWLTDELNKLLDNVGGGPHHRKRRTTILRLAEGAAIGRTETDTLKLPDTCTRSTWYGQGRPDGEGGWIREPGWRDDPAMQAALEAATRRAHWYQDHTEARRIAKRQEDVARAKDRLAELAHVAAQTLGVLLGQDTADDTRRKAANDILDRADESTASKATPAQAAASSVTVFLPDNRRGDGPPCDEDEGADG